MNGNVLCNRGKRGQWEQEKHGLAETESGKQRESVCGRYSARSGDWSEGVALGAV